MSDFRKREIPKIAGMNLDYLMNEDVKGIEIITEEVNQAVRKNVDTLITKASVRVNVDPEALIKQAKLISDLRKALDICGNQIIGGPFTEYIELLKENEKLKETIRMLSGGND